MTTLMIDAVGKISALMIDVGISKLKKFYLSKLSPLDKMYQLLINEIETIEKKLDVIINEPYKTACAYLQLGSFSDNINDFLECEQNALRAFNLVSDVKSKISCMCLILMAIEKYYNNDMYNKRLIMYMNIFINDTTIRDLFDYIKRNRHNIGNFFGDIFLGLVCAISCLTIVGVPILLGVSSALPPVNSFKLNNFGVEWDNTYNFNKGGKNIWPGISHYSCHYDKILYLVAMDNIIDDIKKIDILLSYFVMKLDIRPKISITCDIFWTFNNENSITQQFLYATDLPGTKTM